MSASQDLPLTGVPAATIGVLGGAALAVGAMLVAASRFGARLRRPATR
jgi:hypothetical protein